MPHKDIDHTTIAQDPWLAFMVFRATQGTEEGCQGAKAVRSEATYGRQSTALPSPQSVKSSAESDHFLPEHSWSCDTTGDPVADLRDGNPSELHEGKPGQGLQAWCPAGGTHIGALPQKKAWKSVTQGISWEWLKLGCPSLANLFVGKGCR